MAARYWLIDSAIDSTKPLAWLRPTYADLAIALARPHHRLTLHHLVDHLHELLASNYLYLRNPDVRDAQDDGWRPQPWSRASLEQWVAGTTPCLLEYGVTSQGGTWWEQHSQPNWHTFSWIDGSCSTRRTTSITTSSQSFTETVLKVVCGALAQRDCSLLAETMVWQVLEPWEATYWKTLPYGVRVSFVIPPSLPKIEVTDGEMQYWYEQFGIINRWYTFPDFYVQTYKQA